MRGLASLQGKSRHHAYCSPEILSLQEPSVYHGKMRTAPEGATSVDVLVGVSAETVHAISMHQNKMLFQSPMGVIKEIVWDHSEKTVHFVLDDGSVSPTFVFPVLTDLEAHFTAILALPDLEKPPEQVYIGILIGQNLPSPIQQRRASLGTSQPMLPMSKRRELLRREQPVRNAMSRERLGLEYIRNGYLCFTCSINSDLRGLTLNSKYVRIFPSPDCHDRSACLFSYSYEHLETCDVSGTRLELRFRTIHQLAKQPNYLVFQSLESQYIREAIWYLKHGTYMDASLREQLASPIRTTTRISENEASQQVPQVATSRRVNGLLFFNDIESLRHRLDACCRVIGCEELVDCGDHSGSRPEEVSTSNVMIHINSGELSHVNPNIRTNPSNSRVSVTGLCDFHASCLVSAPNEAFPRQKSILSRDKAPKTRQPLSSLLQSTHYATMFKFQGQLLKRQNGRTFHLRKTWHAKFLVLFETPLGGFLCYYDKVTHCPGMTETPKERRIIDLSSVLCIRPVSTSSPAVSRGSATTPTVHAFDVVTLYRTWTFAAMEPEKYEIWLYVLTECVEKHATIAPDKVLRFPVKLAMTGHSSSSEATSLEISSYGVSFCTGHEAEVVLSSWYYTELEKWSVVYQQGYTCCLLKCRSPAPGSRRILTGDTVIQDYLFRTTDASAVCLAIEFYVGKCMAKLEVLAGQYLDETRAQKSKTNFIADPVIVKRNPKLQLRLVREHAIENVTLAPVGSPEKEVVELKAFSVTRTGIENVDAQLPLDVVDSVQDVNFEGDKDVQHREETVIDDMGEFESIDLGEAVVETTGSQKECEIDQDAGQDDLSQRSTILLGSHLDLNVEDSQQTQSSSIDECVVHQEEKPRAAHNEDENCEASLSSGVFMEPYRADILTSFQVPINVFKATLELDNLLVSPPTPLFLLECTSQTSEDDRVSESEVSDRSDAFNSCTSEADPLNQVVTYDSRSPAVEEADPVPPTDSDEVFEDAVDLESKEDLLPTLNVVHQIPSLSRAIQSS